jgi:hypothetical protein
MSCHDLVSWKAESITGEKPRPTPGDEVLDLRIGESTLFPAFGHSARFMAPSFMAQQILCKGYALLSMAS